MTSKDIDQLKQKHFKAHWNTSEETAEKHRDISIEFAIQCLESVYCGDTYKNISDKIKELKQNLKQ